MQLVGTIQILFTTLTLNRTRQTAYFLRYKSDFIYSSLTEFWNLSIANLAPNLLLHSCGVMFLPLVDGSVLRRTELLQSHLPLIQVYLSFARSRLSSLFQLSPFTLSLVSCSISGRQRRPAATVRSVRHRVPIR